MKSWLCGLMLLSVCAGPTSALPLGDTQGTVSAVRIRPASGTVNSFEVWFSQVQNDRFGCLGGGGRIVVYDNGSGVTPESFKQMFAVALVAQTNGKTLALDSAGTNPCSNVNTAWVVG